jgi:hypothetical protein
MMRTLLRFDPWVPYGRVWLDPTLPDGVGPLRITGLPLAGTRVTLEVDERGAAEITGLPEEIEVLYEPRTPVSVLVGDH